MGILIINEYGKDSREFRICDEQVRIGRDPEGDVVLEDAGVSRAHVRILRKDNQFLIEDLGSRNGTLVNDGKLPARESHPLRHGDIIRIGRSLLKVIIKISKGIAKVLKKATTGTPAAAPAKEVEEPSRPERPLCLFLLQKLRALLLAAKKGEAASSHSLRSDRVRIGRSARSDIVLDDPTVSEDHAEIAFQKEGFFLVDRDSALGTFLDGVSVRVARLSHRSFVKFGKVECLFAIHEEGKEPPEASFGLRDHLAGLFPERANAIQESFRESRESGRDFAEELVLRGILLPGEWWAAISGFKEKPATGPAGWLPGFLRHRPKKS